MEESRQLYKLSEINSHQKLTPKIYKNYAKIHRRASFLLFFPYALFLFANKTESMLAWYCMYHSTFNILVLFTAILFSNNFDKITYYHQLCKHILSRFWTIRISGIQPNLYKMLFGEWWFMTMHVDAPCDEVTRKLKEFSPSNRRKTTKQTI